MRRYCIKSASNQPPQASCGLPGLFFLLLLLCGSSSAFAQKTIKGSVKDNKGAALSAASVNLKNAAGSILRYTRSDDKGNFTLLLPETNEALIVEASSIGYEKKSLAISHQQQIYNLALTESTTQLKTVEVKNRPALSLNGDTLSYTTSDFASLQDRSIGDVIRKMPGIEVAENGKISYNGKAISALYIDGDNVLDDKYSIGTKSIPHGAVDKVQVIEKDQPVKMLRQNNMSEDVALNLVIKEDAKLKVMGDMRAGLGSSERFDANVNAMLFRKNLKFIDNLKGNNTGDDPGTDLTAFNRADFQKRMDNGLPAALLSTGAAGVPMLPQRRTLFNRAGLLNLNNLYKLNDDFQLKLNLAYLHDQRRQQYDKLSETFLDGQTIRYAEQQQNSSRPQQFQSKLNLVYNSEKYYVNNNLTVNYTPEATTSLFYMNGSAARQTLQEKLFELANELNYQKKLASGNTVNFYSYLSQTKQPEALEIWPGLNERLFNNGQPYAGLNQEVQLPSFYTYNYSTFAIGNSRFMQSYRAGFSLQQQSLESALYKTDDFGNSHILSGDAMNALHWFKTRWFVDANYDLQYGKFKTSLNMPVNYQYIRYRDKGHDLANTLSRVFISPSLHVRYQLGIENYLTANYAYQNNIGGIDDIYQGVILKNYRSLFANDAPLSEQRTQTAGLNLSYRKAIQLFFLNAGVNYSNTALNTISSYTLSKDIQQRVVLPFANHLSSLMANINSSKYLFAIRSTVNAGISYSRSGFSQLQNEQLLPFTSKTWSYKAGFETKLSSYLQWSYNATYMQNSNRSAAAQRIRNNNTQLRQQSALTGTLFKRLFSTLSAEHLYTHQAGQPDIKYLFADFNLRYKLMKFHTDLELNISNLTNIRTFEATYLSANTFSSGQYRIPGRIAMLRATFSF